MSRRFWILVSAIAVIASTSLAQGYKVPGIIPKPTSLVKGNENSCFEFNTNTKVVCKLNGKDVKYAMNELDRITMEIFGKKLKRSSKITGANNIIIKENTSLGDEAYTLDITPENIIIQSKSGAGLFYAMQTLKQSIPVQAYETPLDLEKVALPTFKIKDAPHFVHRGYMLDCSRHFWSVETIKEMIDILAMHKMNRFHWHLTEDQGWRIEIKKYPLLTEIGSLRTQTTTGKNEGLDGIPYGGYYTQKEIKEIVKYAQERFITIIPEIEIPGHSLGALSAYPWSSVRCQWKRFILCIARISSTSFTVSTSQKWREQSSMNPRYGKCGASFIFIVGSATFSRSSGVSYAWTGTICFRVCTA